MATLQHSPKEVLETIAVMLGQSIDDLFRFGSTCRSFYATVTHDSVIWQDLAVIKFGSAIARRSAATFYGHKQQWKILMMDDNKRGALPTLIFSQPLQQQVCNYIYNRPTYHFCCLVSWVRWDRMANEIQVYIDVRGESDLRHPLTSSLAQRQGRHGSKTIHCNIPPLRFVAHQSISSPKHHKGYLVFPAPNSVGNSVGEYTFCYGNRVQIPRRNDYDIVTLFWIRPKDDNHEHPSDNSSNNNTQEYTFRDDSPFDHDTKQKCRARFAAVVP
jgi:hypothetical protein